MRVELIAIPEGTRMSIEHMGLPHGPVSDAHERGWASIAGRLASAI